MNKSQIKYVLLLFLTALIWGSAFVAQRQATDDVGPFTFNASRMLLAGVALLPVARFMGRRQGGAPAGNRRTLVVGGVACGVMLAAASYFQQAGIGYTSVGKAGFITAMYIIIVPLMGLVVGKKIRPLVWGGVALAAVGMYFLCMNGETGINRGDALCLICAALFSGHIMCVDYFSPRADGVRLSLIQFFAGGALNLILALVVERPSWSQITAAWLPILYAGVLSSAVGYTLQIIAQKKVEPTLASLIMSLESVFSALAAWALLGQTLSAREIMGCALMFGAIILAQLPGGRADASST